MGNSHDVLSRKACTVVLENVGEHSYCFIRASDEENIILAFLFLKSENGHYLIADFLKFNHPTTQTINTFSAYKWFNS